MAIPETPAARLRALRQRWEADRSSRVFLQLAEEYRRQGQPLEALPVLEEGLRHHAASIAGQVALGRCRLEVGQAEGAAAVLEKVVERDPTQMVAYRTLVDAYIRLGAATEARDRLSHYGQLNPQDPEIDSLGQQIETLERAAVPVASPDRTVIDTVEAVEARPAFAPPEPAPSAEPAGFAAGAEGEAVATPWPSGSASPPDLPANRWSTATFEPGWISPSVERAAPGPRSFEPARPVTEQATTSWSSGWSTNDSPTQMFAMPELPSEPAPE
ncbi:MAG TPA: tetratricopeptide repeat protein, partial [Acidimicrobiia bacterium]|nr:tetratricopeptide repeat protein [Acidimicrobiia bacterium]